MVDVVVGVRGTVCHTGRHREPYMGDHAAWHGRAAGVSYQGRGLVGPW